MFELRLMNNQTEGIFVDENLDLLSSLRSAGADPICDCSGQGHCGKCKAHIVAGNITGLTELEKQILSPEEIGAGWFLMCQRKPLDDLIIDMPQRDTVNFIKEKKLIEMNFSPVVKREVFDFKQIDEEEFEDYYSLILAAFADKGVKSISPLALGQLIPAVHDGDGKITVTYSEQIMIIEPGDTTDVNFAVACDLGTASVGMEIIDMANGCSLGKAFAGNSQRSFGIDMVHRVEYVKAHDGDCSELTKVLRYTINKLLAELCQRLDINTEHIYNVQFAGNPQMTHLLFGITPLSSDGAPVFLKLQPQNAVDIGINVNRMAQVCAAEAFSGEFGGDTAVIAGNAEDHTLIVDLGVDTDLILKLNGAVKMQKLSTPVFDGMCLHQGMINGSGSVQGMYFDEQSQNAFTNTYDMFSAKGISGSGFCKLYRDMKNLGYLTDDNKFAPEAMPEFLAGKLKDTLFGKQLVIFGGGFMSVAVTEKDIEIYLKAVGELRDTIAEFIGETEVKKVIITGSAGAEWDLSAVEAIGFLPRSINWDKVEFVAELALKGVVKRLMQG